MKHFYNLRKSTFSFLVSALTLFAFSTFLSLESKAQTTITTTFTNNNGFACVTFNFQNTNATAVTITDIASICGVAGPQDVSAWFKPSAINGSPGNISTANGWTQFGSASITGIANTTTSTPQPFMSGLNLSIPAGATYGIAVTATNLRYSSLTPGTYTIPGGGCNIITGTDIGFAGAAPPATPANNNRGFIGSVTFSSISVACSGTPTPGNTVSTANPVCTGVPFTLTPQNNTSGTGVTYQWQSSPNNTTYTDVSGATSSSLTTSQTAATWYKLKVTCGANSTFTTALNVTMAAATACYCAAGATNTGFEKISNVAFNTINNPSTSTAGYENFTAITTMVNPGQTLPITVTISTPFVTDQVIVFIDFNQDGDFTDVGETVYTSAAGNGPHTGNITIPASATAGNTRMRVRMHDSDPTAGPNATSCGNSTYGQVEDYTVNIGSSTACSGTPAPGNTLSTVAAPCPAQSFTLSPQNATSGTGVTYQWQSSPNGTTYTDISGATSSLYTTSQTAATYYKLRVTCGANSAFTTALLVNMGLPTACYCAAGATSTGFEKIARVVFNTINNPSTSTAGYENFTTISSTVATGSTYSITVTINAGFATDMVLVWIDLNQDGDFTDAGENVYTSLAGVGPHTGAITIPASAIGGSTRMRIRLHDSDPTAGPNATPCGNSTYGQVEDYTLNILCTAAVTTNPASATTSCGGTVVFNSAGSGNPSFQWQVSTNGGGSWTNLTNTAPYSGVTTNQLTITGVTSTLNTYQYRVVLSNPCTVAANSNAATLTVNTPGVPILTPLAPIICAGGIAQLNLTGPPLPGPSNVITTETGTGFTNLGLIGGNVALTFAVQNTTATPRTLTRLDMAWNTTYTAGSAVATLWVTTTSLGGAPTIAAPAWTQIATANMTITANGIIPTFPSLSYVLAPNTTYRFAVSSTNGINYSPAAATPNTFTVSGVSLIVNNAILTGGNVGYAGAFPSPLNTPRAFQGRIYVTSPPIPGGPQAGIFTPNTGLFTDPGGLNAYTGTSVSTIYAKPTVTTNYSVAAGVTGCLSAPVAFTVRVNQPASFTTQPTAVTLCENGNATFGGAATGTAPLALQWQVSTDGGTTWTDISGANSGTLSLSNVTNAMNGNRYRLSATAPAPCGPTFSNAVALTVRPLPVVTITANPRTKLIPTLSTTLTANVVGATPASFRWFRNGTQVTGASGSTLVVNIDQLGDYTASVTDVNGCISLISPLLNISDSATGRVFLYPNPNKGKFKVRFYTEFYGTLPGGPVNNTLIRYLEVYNAQGQKIMDKPFSVSAPYAPMDVDLSPWGSGTYWIEIKDVAGKRLVVGRAVVL